MVTPADFAPRAWYRAEESGLVGGVFTATDLSGNGRHATQSTASRQPTRVYRPSGIYSYAWQFDGTDDYLQGHTDVVAAQDAQTVIALATLTGSSTTRRAWGFGAFYSLFASGSQWGYYANSSDAIVNLGGNTSDWTVVAVRQFNASAESYFPNTLTTYDLGSSPLSGVTLTQGSNYNGKPTWQSGIFEIAPGDERYFDLRWQSGEDSYWSLVLDSPSYDPVAWVNSSPALFPAEAFIPTDPENFDEITLLPPEEPAARASRNDGTTAATWTPKNVMSSPPCLAIGAESTLTGAQPWPGFIAEVVVINDYIGLSEIQSLYDDYFYHRYFVEPPEPTSDPKLIVFGSTSIAGDAAVIRFGNA